MPTKTKEVEIKPVFDLPELAEDIDNCEEFLCEGYDEGEW